MTIPEDADMWGGGLIRYRSGEVSLLQTTHTLSSPPLITTPPTHWIYSLRLAVMGYISHGGENRLCGLVPMVTFDSLMLYMGVGVLPMPTRRASSLRGIGDELRLYYTGYDQPHDKVP